MVRELANIEQCSEYEIFERGLDYWNSGGVDAAFVEYILYDTIPWKVRDYCRKELHKSESAAIKGIDSVRPQGHGDVF
jgi:hypothetical protein